MIKQVFIFGAGASVHSGAPLARKLMYKMMEYVETDPPIIQYQPKQIDCLKYYLLLFYFNKCKDSFDIEMFCTMLDFLNFDFYIQCSQKDLHGKFEHIVGKEGITHADEVLKIIQILVTHILSPLKIKDKRQILQKFVSKYVRRSDTLLSFNYDLLLDQALWEASLWTPYEGYICIDSKKSPEEFKSHPNLVTYLKLHGSINWSSSQVFGTSWGYFDRKTGTSYFKGIPNGKKNKKWVDREIGYMIYPTYFKNFSKRNVLKEIWALAFKKIKEAKKIWIIGYSIPDADAFANFLLMNISKTAQLIIINTEAKDIERKIKVDLFLKNKIQLFQSSLEDFIQDANVSERRS